MADEGPWEAKVKKIAMSGTTWAQESYNDESWETEMGAFGTKSESEYASTSIPSTATSVFIENHANDAVPRSVADTRRRHIATNKLLVLIINPH